MSERRIICKNSKRLIYHKPDCRHVEHMLPENRVETTLTQLSYSKKSRPCKCCNNMKHQYLAELEYINEYQDEKRVQLKQMKDSLYIKTNIGLWKIVYDEKNEDLVLFHRNNSSIPIDFDHPENESYHRQTDVPYSDTIYAYIHYIRQHDKYQSIEQNGGKVKYAKKKYRKQAEMRKWREKVRRMDAIFEQLEMEKNEEENKVNG